MHYADIHALLKQNLPKTNSSNTISELGIRITRYAFESSLQAQAYLSGSDALACESHNLHFDEAYVSDFNSSGGVALSDFEIECNKYFNYYIVQSSSVEKANGMILFFHGLNEKHWDKYLPWAYAIAKRTHKAVVLFPIAFHMDRAPEAWSNRVQMTEIAKERAQVYPENAASSSFINAAISSRLEHFPQRLFWSGFQTYADVVKLIENVNADTIPEIALQASVDLFGYSIGSFLSCILKMANPKGYFSQSKLFCFCGGMTIDRMFPISKYIMDASAAIAMQRSYAELLSSNFTTDDRLGHYQDWKKHPEEAWFKTMLRYNYFLHEREALLQKMEHQIMALVLRQDVVAPPIEALNTLKGGYRNIPIEVVIDDYNYPYSHMNPFSLMGKHQPAVDEAFERFTNLAGDFLK